MTIREKLIEKGYMNEAIEFVKWIAKLNVPKYNYYDGTEHKWYISGVGHFNSEELYEFYIKGQHENIEEE